MRSANVAVPTGLGRWIPTIDQFPNMTSVAEPDHRMLMELLFSRAMFEFFRGFTFPGAEEWYTCQETRRGGQRKDMPP